MERKFAIKLCYRLNVTDTNVLLEKVSSKIGFNPTVVTTKDDQYEGPFTNKEIVQKLKELSSTPGGIALSDEFSSSSLNYIKFDAYNLITLTWSLNNLIDTNFNTLIELIELNGFVCGYMYNYNDVIWQNQKNVGVYEQAQKPHNHLKKVSDSTYGLLIDITENHGRSSMIYNYFLISAPEMYFSNLFYELVPKETLLKAQPFSDATEVLKNELIHIKLFDVYSNPENIENRGKQKKFRQLVNMDKLETIEMKNKGNENVQKTLNDIRNILKKG